MWTLAMFQTECSKPKRQTRRQRDIEPRFGTKDLGRKIWDTGSGAQDLGHTIWDAGFGTLDLDAGFGTQDLGHKIWDARFGTQDLGGKI